MVQTTDDVMLSLQALKWCKRLSEGKEDMNNNKKCILPNYSYWRMEELVLKRIRKRQEYQLQRL
jgi:hypothetical protein